jgi:hypothetical protein
MPFLGIAKRRLADKLGSVATRGEGTQNLLCAYLATAVLFGLLANALLAGRSNLFGRDVLDMSTYS